MTDFDPNEFDQLMQKVRAGDAQAATTLFETFEPEIRREIRIRLTDPRLRRVVDSIDICQSVMGNFFVRAALGQFDLEHPNQLFRLLATMAKNKVIDQHRSEQVRTKAQNGYVPEQQYDRHGEPLDRTDGPGSVAENREMLKCALEKLSEEERRIVTLRQQGKSWDEVATVVGINSPALRKKISRACDRIMKEHPST